MPRVDVWDIPEDKPFEPIWIGYKRGLTEKYELGKKLGEGGFGSVRVVVQRSNGVEFACKSICKRLEVPNLPPIKQQQHLENIKREVLILRKLRGTLNVVHLSCVYEDESHVHIIMEFCRGGELFHKMGRRHYSERTVASYMRAVLRTLAQCHAHRILHRDIKPGNFMLLTEAEDSPLKAIDFGLAVFFDPAKLPRTDLGLEGTPWYMAPEVLSSSVEPASDVWAAGVMAYQLLSGRFPFDDWAHPEAPALSLVWRSILSESPSFKANIWKEISEPAKDFCRTLLNKDPSSRPSARDALTHPWLQKGNTKQRLQGAQLTQVVQRLQRHSQQNAFKKTVLDMMANELLARHMARAQQDTGAGAAATGAAAAAAAAAAGGGGGGGDDGSGAAVTAAHKLAANGAPPSTPQGSGSTPNPPTATAANTSASPAATATAGVRQLPGLMGAAVVTPQYAEGSVHRQQQLLRLVPPPKRTSSSLDLNPDEISGLKAARLASSKEKNPSWHGAAPGQGLTGFSPPGAAGALIAAAGAGTAGASAPASPAGLGANRWNGAAGRLEGTWHGPGGIGLRQGSAVGGSAGGGGAAQGLGLGGNSPNSPGFSGLEGSLHRQGATGSLRGASSALEALRRARERAAAAAAQGADPAGAGAAGGAAGLSLADAWKNAKADGAGAGAAADAAAGAAPPAAATAGESDGAAASDPSLQGYKGPVRDPSTASMWDLQFMANRMAMEGSAHGNAYTHRVLRAASTHASKAPAAAALWPAQQQQQQEQQDTPQQQQQQQPVGTLQLRVSEAAQKQQQQQATAALQESSSNLGAAAAVAAAQGRLEGTWHGPSRSASITVAAALRHRAAAEQQQVDEFDRDLKRDVSWHGQTSHMRIMREQDTGSQRATEREEFMRFLEAAKRQRQEQRKVARLVLEGSTHGGVQYFLPARGTSSVAVPAGSSAAPGPGSLGEEEDASSEMSDDDDDEDNEDGQSARISASGGSRASFPSTPGSSGHGSNAAATAAGLGVSADGSSAAAGSRGLLGKLKHSFKHLITAGGPDAATAGGGGGAGAGAGAAAKTGGSRGGSATDLNSLARESWRPAVTPPAPAAAAAGGGESSRGTSKAKAGKKVQIAEQALDLESPLETRRRGQGAYAALMAATNTAADTSPEAAAGAVAVQPASAADAAASKPSQPEAADGAAAQPTMLRPKSVPKHVGFCDEQQEQGPVQTPLEQALEVQTRQQTQQQQATSQHMLLQPGTKQQQPQQQVAAKAGALLPQPSGQSQESLLPMPSSAAAAAPTWQPPKQDSWLPVPQSKQQQQQQNGTHGAGAKPAAAATTTSSSGGGGGGMDSLVPLPGSNRTAPKPSPAAAPAKPQPPVGGRDAGLVPTPGSAAGNGVTAPKPEAAAAPVASSRQNAAVVSPAVAGSAAGAAASYQPSVAPAAASSKMAAGAVPPPPAAAVAAAAGDAVASDHILPALDQVQQLLDMLEVQCSSDELITVEQLQAGLASLGYNLEPSEVLELAQNLGYGVEGAEGVPLSQFAASQLDWEAIQVNHRDEWLQCLRATFDAMDVDKDGRLMPSELLEALRDKLPEAEVNAAIEDVLLEAAADEDEGLDFAAFKMLASLANDSLSALDQYDARLKGGSSGNSQGGDASSGGGGGSVRSAKEALQLLQPVPEADA